MSKFAINASGAMHVVAKFSPSHVVNFWVRCASGIIYQKRAIMAEPELCQIWIGTQETLPSLCTTMCFIGSIKVSGVKSITVENLTDIGPPISVRMKR